MPLSMVCPIDLVLYECMDIIYLTLKSKKIAQSETQRIEPRPSGLKPNALSTSPLRYVYRYTIELSHSY